MTGPESVEATGSDSRKDSIGRTILVALAVSLSCSILVATAAVLLKPQQLKNRLLNRQEIILEVSGLMDPDQTIEELFDQIETRIIEIETGDYRDDLAAKPFDSRQSARDPETSVSIPSDIDSAKLRRRSRYAQVYLLREKNEVARIILPIQGYGLWSTMYGYIALERDANTVYALRFYEHAETPGLGDQIDAQRWLGLWPGKRIYDSNGNPALEVIKGSVLATHTAADFQVDGLSGATLTGNGVTNMLHYWFGDQAYGPYLQRLRSEGKQNGN